MKKLFTALLCALLCCTLLLSGCKNGSENQPSDASGTSGISETNAQNDPGGSTAAEEDDPAQNSSTKPGGTAKPGETTTGGSAGNTPGGSTPQGTTQGGDAQDSTQGGNNTPGGTTPKEKTLLTQYDDAVQKFRGAKSYEIKQVAVMNAATPLGTIKQTTTSSIYGDKANAKKPRYYEEAVESGLASQKVSRYYADGFYYTHNQKSKEKVKEEMSLAAIQEKMENDASRINSEAVIAVTGEALKLPGGKTGKRIVITFDVRLVKGLGLEGIAGLEAQLENGTVKLSDGKLTAELNEKGELLNTRVVIQTTAQGAGLQVGFGADVKREYISVNKTKVQLPNDLGSYTLKTA